ncbi:hypothetical protein CEXT_177481 [Caerostris extrusa]|uniref:Uncharacterized protein n=1 Tax=Caerostris extrusa TaxID=172846 RepID=A0AAV4XTZ5_CAEEX|nr:hypothetical protein CEXT_177481 [Caerostris extrusa]
MRKNGISCCCLEEIAGSVGSLNTSSPVSVVAVALLSGNCCDPPKIIMHTLYSNFMEYEADTVSGVSPKPRGPEVIIGWDVIDPNDIWIHQMAKFGCAGITPATVNFCLGTDL